MAGLFNMFGGFYPNAAQPQTQQYNYGSEPQLAGRNQRIREQVLQQKELLDSLGIDKNDFMGRALAIQSMNQWMQNDPATEQQKLQMYEGTMNRLADAANERAMKGHLFAGLINLPNKWQEAMAEKYRFVQPQMELAARGSSMSSPFLTRQYINI